MNTGIFPMDSVDETRSPGLFQDRSEGSVRVLTLFGTRPEAIKLAPVIKHLESFGSGIRTINVSSSQHTHLLYPLLELFDIRVDHDLRTMEPDQTPNQVCARVMSGLDPILLDESPDLILVQGDTTTAMAGAIAGFNRKISVGHVEAGLRSGDVLSPFPEEMNRRVITSVASYHFAATKRNRITLLGEGVASERIFVTGNPVVDSLNTILTSAEPSNLAKRLLESTEGKRRLVLTTHRRESFGEKMAANLRCIRRFVDAHIDVVVFFPVHPNPSVADQAAMILADHPRIHLLEPLEYTDFIFLLAHCWLIVSDSGGVQEEAPTLGKPVLILRENTERLEAIDSGVARLVGGDAEQLYSMMLEAYAQGSWIESVKTISNPFGRGDSGAAIANAVVEIVSAKKLRNEAIFA
jgi:UDP-N-acetylglucosamine 2-epimerase (non-hydrolysing)